MKVLAIKRVPVNMPTQGLFTVLRSRIRGQMKLQPRPPV